MKFKEWFKDLPEEIIKDSVFECIGYCPKWFFHAYDEKSAKELKEKISKGWGPSEYEIIDFVDSYYDDEINQIYITVKCDDGNDHTEEERQDIDRTRKAYLDWKSTQKVTDATNGDMVGSMSDPQLAVFHRQYDCPPAHYEGEPQDCANVGCRTCWCQWFGDHYEDKDDNWYKEIRDQVEKDILGEK